MNKKSFFLGVLTGSIFTFIVLLVIAFAFHKSEGNDTFQHNDPVEYLEKPVSYENKEETSFEILQVLDNGALAKEASDEIGDDAMYYGNTVIHR